MKEYQSKVSVERKKQCLSFFIDPSSQGVNRHSVLLFKNDDSGEAHKGYFLLKVEIKDYNVMTMEKNSLINQQKMI